MSNSEQLLDQLGNKIHVLLQKHKETIVDLNKIKTELEESNKQTAAFKSQLEQKDEKISALNDALEVAQESQKGNEIDENLNERVNLLVSEIDECISLLKEG